MIRFLPSYVGSKKYWVQFLEKYKNEDFVELFCGSAVLSANLAKSAILNDLDPKVYQILYYFDALIVPEIFTSDDFEKYKKQPDWWRWAYCLQKMSFSGVFRYSKNGYNVPIKKNKGEAAVKEIRVLNEYNEALSRWIELNPIVLNKSYYNINLEFLRNKVVVLDPPYENSQASYNSAFDYGFYWKYLEEIKKVAKVVIIFDRKKNLEAQSIPIIGVRKMRVNGGKEGDVEAIGIFENGAWSTAVLNEKSKIENVVKVVEPIILKKKRGRPKGSKNKPKI